MQTSKAKISYRIPLVGGFTDYPEFYKKHGAKTISCTINRYLHVLVGENGKGGIQIESKSDLPWGIGLGSSGAFYSALILALSRAKQQRLSRLATAKLAYDLETGIDQYGTGRQDSVACLFKGISKISYYSDDSIMVDQVPVSFEWKKTLSSRLLLFDTGVRRQARNSIKDILSRKNRAILKEIAELPDALIRAWESRDIDFLGTALDLQEKFRSRLSPTCRSLRTDGLLEIARKSGAGARLTGAGLGCLLCYCHEEKQYNLREKLNLPEIKFMIL